MHCWIPCSQTEWLELAPCPPPLGYPYTRQYFIGFMTSLEASLNNLEAEKIMNRCSNRWRYPDAATPTSTTTAYITTAASTTTITTTNTTTKTTTAKNTTITHEPDTTSTTTTNSTTTKFTLTTVATTNATISVVLPILLVVLVAVGLSFGWLIRKRRNLCKKDNRRFFSQTSNRSIAKLIKFQSNESSDGQKLNATLAPMTETNDNFADNVINELIQNPDTGETHSIRKFEETKVSDTNVDGCHNPAPSDRTLMGYENLKIISENSDIKDDKREFSPTETNDKFADKVINQLIENPDTGEAHTLRKLEDTKVSDTNVDGCQNPSQSDRILMGYENLAFKSEISDTEDDKKDFSAKELQHGAAAKIDTDREVIAQNSNMDVTVKTD